MFRAVNISWKYCIVFVSLYSKMTKMLHIVRSFWFQCTGLISWLTKGHRWLAEHVCCDASENIYCKYRIAKQIGVIIWHDVSDQQRYVWWIYLKIASIICELFELEGECYKTQYLKLNFLFGFWNFSFLRIWTNM